MNRLSLLWTLLLFVTIAVASPQAIRASSADNNVPQNWPSHYNSGTPRTAADMASEAKAMAGKAAVLAGDYVTAESDYRAAIAGYPHPGGDDYYGLAVALTGQGRDTEALQTYHYLFYELPVKNCVNSDTPSVVQAYQEQFAQKLYADPTRYSGFGSDTPDAWMRYALLLCQAGQWAEAVRFYEGALPSLPQMGVKLDVHFSPPIPQPTEMAAAAHVALGMFANFGYGSFGGGDDYRRAMTEFDQAQRLLPDAPLTNYYYGYGLQKLGRTAEAKAAFQRTVKIAKGDVKVAAQKALAPPKKPV